jgi:hypothetical protein
MKIGETYMDPRRIHKFEQLGFVWSIRTIQNAATFKSPN